MKRNFKWVLALCAVLVLMLGLLSGCGEKKVADDQELELYWNVEGNNYLGNPGEVPVRRMESDGYYYVRFAHGGEQERYKVAEDAIKKGLDLYKLVGLIFDENGVVVDFQTVEECRGGYFAKEFFVEAIDGNTITCNSASTFLGYQKTFELTDDINVYYVKGDGPLVGMEAKIQLDDEITVICDRDGKITDCYVAPLDETPTVYFSKVRMYNSTSKATTRETDLAGTYSFEMAVNGGPVTVKTKDATIASKMDSFAARNMILTFDEDGYVDSAVSGDSVCGVWSSWFNVLQVEDRQITTVRSRQATNLGTKTTAQMARNFVAYDVNPYAEVYGAVTELRKGDTVHCLKNSRGQIAIAFVVNRKMDGEVYWNVTRMYNATTKETTRTPNEEGWYEILMTTRGEQFTLKTKDKALVTKIDARADKHCGLVVENGIIKEFYTPADITGGGAIASWYDVMHISEDGKKIGALRTIDTNIGSYYEALLADDCMIYDVSGQGDFVGQLTEIQMYDRIHGELNDEGKLGIVYVVRRLADSDMYWNVEQKYNDTTKSTTRGKWSDGYYRVTLAVNGKQATYKVADKEVMNSIDKRPYLRSFGVELEGNVITKVYEPGLVTGGGGFASWADITSIKDGVITAVKTTKSDTQKIGTVYTAKMAEDCEVYDVTELAKLDSYIGVKTTPRIGDRIYGHLNLDGEIQVLYIVGNRLKSGYLAWNFARKYDSTNKVSTRVPDEDGWYKVDLAVNGKHVVWKTKDKALIDKVDSAYWSGLVVNKDGEILAHYPYNLIYGGYSQASWYDVTRISGSYVTAKKTISANDQGKVVTFKRTYNCKVYDVSENYVDHRGEETTLQVGDRIHVMNASNNIDARVIYIVWRPDRPGEPDHFHCECGDGSASGVGQHVCDESFGWSAWTNPRKLPTSGNWYLDTDVTLTAGYSIPADSTLKLCLNGHTINGSTTARIYYNAGDLTFTDCTDAGQVIANSNTNGSIVYAGPTTDGSKLTVYGGTYKNSLEQMSKSGAIIFVGDKVGIAKMDIYGGTFVGANNSYPGANFYVMGDSYVNMYGGTITGGTSAGNGGSMYINAGQINLYGGTITGGKAVLGDSVYMSTGTLGLYGTSISDGTVVLVKADAEVTGGTVAGGLDVQGQSTIALSGNPVISGSADYNLRLSNGENVTLGDFTEGAEIYVRSTVLNVPIATLADPADKGFFFCDDDDAAIEFTAENQLVLKANHTHCVCGTGAFNGVGTHTCDATVGWTKWTDSTKLPTTSGYYYLATDVTMTAGASIGASADVHLCLNGHTVNGPTTARIYYTAGKLTITDCKPVAQQGQMIANADQPGSVIYSGPSAQGSLLTIYGGTYKSSLEKMTKVGAIIFIGDSKEGIAKMDMYGGSVIGTKSTTSGATLYMMWDAYVNLYGGTVTGGNSNTYGGNIYVHSGELNLLGGIVTGGKAAAAGDNIHMADGALNVHSGTVSNGNIYVAKGKVGVTGGTISGGLDIQSPVVAEISGKPVISGGAYNLRVCNAENVTIGDLQTGAEIYIGTTTMNVPVATLANLEDKEFLKGDNDDLLEVNGENQIILKAGHVHCDCGTGAFNGVGTHTCDATVGWTKWTDSTKLPTASGYYYLGTDVTMTAGQSIAGSADVHLCLNGHTVNGPTTARIYYTTGKLTITDCKPVAQQGQMIANANQPGAVIYEGPSADGALLTIYGGTFKSAVEPMSKVGAVIFVGDSKPGISNMDMYGGTVLGANNTSNGGTFYIMGDSTVNLYGGTITGGKTSGLGGNIFVDAGVVNLRGTTITDGQANQQGGNIYMKSGELNVYSGTVSSGTVTMAAAQATVSGGTVSGGLQVLGTSTLSLSDKAAITGLSISDGTKITIGDLTEGAAISLSLTKADDLVGPLADPADKIYFSADKKNTELLMDSENKLYENVKEHKHCICGGAPMTAAAGHVCDETVLWQPISAALEAAGLTVSTADFGKLPSGNYYLDTDLVVTGCTGTTGKEVRLCLNGCDITTTAARVFPSFKESTLEVTDCSYDAEAKTWEGTVYSGSSPYAGIIYTDNLTCLNIYGGNYTDAVADRTHTNGGLFAVANETSKTDATKKAVMNVYGGNIYGAKTTTGGLISVFQFSELNIYGGTLQNGTATSGGLVAFSSEGMLNIFGGIFQNGIASTMGTLHRGGAIYVTRGTLNVKGGTFVGNAAYYGGAIYAIAATENVPVVVNLEGGKFYTGTDYANTTSNRAYHHGGNVYIEGNGSTATLNIKAGADIGYGHLTNADFNSKIEASGGNIYAKNATVNMTGGKVVAGKAVHGGNIFIADGGTAYEYTLTISGGTVSGGQAVHTGYPTVKNGTALVYPVGGNISVNGNEKVIIQGGTIENGTASHAGGNIGVNGTADLSVSGGKIQGGTAAYAGNIHTNNNADVVVTIKGGEITGGTLDRSKNTAGTGACLRLQTNVQLILEGTPKITEIYFVGNTLVDATKLGDLETPIAIVKSVAAAFAEVTADLSGEFSAANGTIRYEAGEGDANGKLYLDIA